jgi:phosphocarrier protein HPr
MYSTNVVVSSKLGLHARPAAQIAMRAEHAKSGVWLISGNEKADAKSVISILMLACQKGSVVTVRVEHRMDVEILNNIKSLIEDEKFQ